ncbi:hypothetical protein G4H71_12845 [Rhodococcus triatomae]|uniref:Uncharacterized protein n=1 Tax=Rhodococcus triatomae TaxID=300028 RepID=A0A1G8GUL7_9NOCA|nr:hypothetical protein [Rhodococcus triatomae]QNG20296.1 hypothetical protein G4H72_17535 [Rhodococcus triatomae]QNG23789.1 hypothetical protein G4H71_12845 [Rhodococcus triatomae]SDH98094.1 hypothetical protein SAMN05444695_104209 [Rhodococcus triatomae]
MKIRALIGGALAVGALGAGSLAFAAPVSATPAAPVQATCPKGHVCELPVECPWEWKLDWSSGQMVWQPQPYCLNPHAVPTEKTIAQKERVRAYQEGRAY